MPLRCRGTSGPQVAALAFGLFLAHALAAGAQPVLPPNFQETIVFSGLAQPTAVKFARDGRVFVAEKSGLVKVFDNLTDPTPTIFADLRTQVHNFWDRGLLGLELHPAFPDVPYVYVLYALDRLPRTAWVDPNPNDGIVDPPIPQWGVVGGTSDGCPTPPGATDSGCAVTGRLSRLTAFGNSAGPEQALIEDWCQQFPSHSIGALAFAGDGALLVSAGDGASFNYADYGQGGGTGGVPVNVCGDPPVPVGTTPVAATSQGGSLRSQSLRRPNQPAVLNGAILRVDPETGHALADNPLAYSTDLRKRRVVAYGLRNPFRMAVRPGTPELWIGDVGWGTWEEIDYLPNPLAGVVNFGWPCYEGAARQGGYDGLNNAICENLYSGVLAPGVDPVAAGSLAAPFYTYNHNADVVSGDVCPPNTSAPVSSAIAGLAFYQGGPYPGSYAGALFFADFNRNCIWAVRAGADGRPNAADRMMFVGRAAGPVHLETGPNGDLFYVSLESGTIRRVRYLGANNAPVASLTANQTTGAAPLAVQFSAAGSTDLDADPLTYAWDLDGDGQFDDATGVTASRTFTVDGVYNVRVRVTDDVDASDEEAIEIRVGNAAPTVTITNPAAGLTWRVGNTIAFSGSATDPQDGVLSGASLTWTLIVNHCPNNDCHQHVVQTWNGTSGSFVAPDHEYPSSLELQLRAVDSGGLASTKSVVLQPQTVTLTVASSPAGMTLGFNAESTAAPFVRTVIIGSSNSITAPSPQTVGGTTYAFQSWSDGGAAAHNVTAPATNVTYTATFTVSTPGLPNGWLNSDVGATGAAGSATWNGSAFTVRGSGSDIWDGADEFHFVYRTLNGDGEIRARVASLTNTDPWAKAGVMIRQSLAAGSPHAMVFVSPGNGVNFEGRLLANGASFEGGGHAATAPYWVRLVRAGNTFTGYSSPNGTTWTLIGSQTITMPANVLVGLPVTSHNDGVLATTVIDQVVVGVVSGNTPPVAVLTADKTTGSAPLTVQFSAAGSSDPDGDPLTYAWDLDNDGQFDDGTLVTATRTFTANGAYTVRIRVTDDESASDIETIAIQVSSAAGLPSGWLNSDVGATGAAGSATWNGSAFTVSGSGSDIWDGADEFHFAYMAMNGDGEIRARVVSLTNTDPWAKAGVMIRQSLAAGSAHAMVFVSPGNGVNFEGRLLANGASFEGGGHAATAPYWVRLVRAGNTFTAYSSPNGTTWTLVGSRTITMPANVLVGLPITSHNDGVLGTAVIEQVTVVP